MRIQDIAACIAPRIDERRAFGHVLEISRHHRVQMSNGYHLAAKHCAYALQGFGVDCRLRDIPFPKGSRQLNQRGFDAWDCRQASLALIGPGGCVLCDYDVNPLCLIQRSISVDAQGVEIVPVQGDKSLTRANVAGKIIFLHDAPWEDVCKRAVQNGALGIITDYITPGYARRREDVYDERSCFNFYWTECPEEIPCFGFVLTPRQGDALYMLCLEEEKKGHRLRCDACIKAEISPGHIEVVEARIPGAEAGEILIIAHLCHGKPSANDNASGCAGAMEAMMALTELIEADAIAPPRFQITMVLMPEVSGTFAYLNMRHKDRHNIKAILNLDMIGRRQEGRSGMLGIMGPCDQTPSFIIDLMALVRRLTDNEAPTFNIDGYVSPFHTQILEYFGGSDHYIYGDPAIGIPGVTLMQWMDKHYHTSGDCVDNIDPEMLKKSISLAAVWVYALATLEIDDVLPLFQMNRERFVKMLHCVSGRAPIKGATLSDVFLYQLEVFSSCLDDILRFIPSAEPLVADAKLLLESWMNETLMRTDCGDWEADDTAVDIRVPVRDMKSPLTFVGAPFGLKAAEEFAMLKARFNGLYGYNSVDNFILFRIDGKRCVHEIARLVGMESRFYMPTYVSAYIDWLVRHAAAHYK